MSSRRSKESPARLSDFGHEFQYAEIFISAYLLYFLSRTQTRHFPLFGAPCSSGQICRHIPHSILTDDRSSSQNFYDYADEIVFAVRDRTVFNFLTIPRLLHIEIGNETGWDRFFAAYEKRLSSRATELTGKNPFNKLSYEVDDLLQDVAVKIFHHNGQTAWRFESGFGYRTYSHSLSAKTLLDLLKRARAQKRE